MADDAIHPLTFVKRVAGRGEPVLLCLDLGQNCGWALLDGGVVTSGVATFKPDRFSGGGMVYLRFNRWLTEMCTPFTDADRAMIVYFEEVRGHKGTSAAHSYGGFLALLTAFCEALGIPYDGVPVGTIKRHLSGKGNASKAAMIAAIEALGHSPVDDNEADALAIMVWGRSQMEV